MKTIQVFDPPMCCSTGICGANIDPALIQFAADLEWVQEQGVEVQRFNLSQRPGAFANTPLVKEALANTGNACLPLIIVDGMVASKGRYPSRELLAGWAQIAPQPSSKKAVAAPCCCGSSPSQTTTGSKRKGTGCC